MSKTKADFVADLQLDVKRARHQLKRLAADLEVNPLDALGGSNQMFVEAARVNVYSYCLGFLSSCAGDDAVALGALRDHAHDEALRGARNARQQSTSPTRNLAEHSATEVWGAVYAELGRYL